MIQYTIITGASSGIGLSLAEILAKEKVPLILACRNYEKSKPLQEKLIETSQNPHIQLEILDQADIRSIKAFVQRVQAHYPIKALINNAGSTYGKYELSPQSYELSIATNCIGPALLCLGLGKQIAENGAIINTISLTSNFGTITQNFPHSDPEKFVRLKNYSSAKLALFLFTHRFAQSSQNLRINAVDPGIVNTKMISMQRWFDPLADLLFRPFTRKPETAAAITVAALKSDKRSHVFSGKGSAAFHKKITEHPQLDTVWKKITEIADENGF